MNHSNQEKQTSIKNNSEEYPSLLIRKKDGNPDFIKIVEKELDKFNFSSLPDHESKVFKALKQVGMERLAIAFLLARKTPESLVASTYIQYIITNAIGIYIYQNLTPEIYLKYYPDNYVAFHPYLDGSKMLVKFHSLLKGQIEGQTFFYSRLKPRIKIDGKQYILAFTQHMIDRVYERTSIDRKNYTSLGDILLFLAACNSRCLELCKLNNGQLAMSFWSMCGDPPFWHSWYIPYVLGKPVPGGGKVFFRLGYAPIVLHDGFAVAKTLLYPGYKSTPEYALLQSSSLSKVEKREMQKKSMDQDALSVVRNLDFSCIKWFHDNGIIQVKQSRHELYNHMDLVPMFYRKQFGLS